MSLLIDKNNNPINFQTNLVQQTSLAESGVKPIESIVNVFEGQIRKASKDQGINFGMISSCLAMAVQFSDGRKLGIHCVTVPEPSLSQIGARPLYEGLKIEIGKRIKQGCAIEKIAIVGQLSNWEPETFGLKGQDIGDTLINDLGKVVQWKSLPPILVGDISEIESIETYEEEVDVPVLDEENFMPKVNDDGSIQTEKKQIDKNYKFTNGATVSLSAENKSISFQHEIVLGELNNTCTEVKKGPKTLLTTLSNGESNIALKELTRSKSDNTAEVTKSFLVMKKITGTMTYMGETLTIDDEKEDAESN